MPESHAVATEDIFLTLGPGIIHIFILDLIVFIYTELVAQQKSVRLPVTGLPEKTRKDLKRNILLVV